MSIWGAHDRYDLDLQQWAPPGWDGRIWYTTVLQAAGPNKSITAELAPRVKQRAATPETAIPEGKGVEVPSSSRAAMRGWTKNQRRENRSRVRLKKDKSIITLRKPGGTELTVRMGLSAMRISNTSGNTPAHKQSRRSRKRRG